MKILKFIFDSLISYIKIPLLAIVGLFQPDTLFSEAVLLIILVIAYWPLPPAMIIIGITSITNGDIVESIPYLVLGIISILGCNEKSNNSNEWRDF